MKRELWNLDLEGLRKLYQEEKAHLEEKLLAGASWEDVSDERKRIGELSTIIYKRSNPAHFGNPAENGSRKTGD